MCVKGWDGTPNELRRRLSIFIIAKLHFKKLEIITVFWPYYKSHLSTLQTPNYGALQTPVHFSFSYCGMLFPLHRTSHKASGKTGRMDFPHPLFNLDFISILC